MATTQDELEQANIDYNKSWGDTEPKPEPVAAVVPKPEPEPAENAVMVAAAAARDKDAKEFTDAFNAPEPAANVPEPKPEPKNFKEAFKAARADGLKVFDWNGKKYTTELTKPKTTVAIVIAPSAGSQMPAPTADKSMPMMPAASKSRVAIINAMRAKDAAIKGVKA